MLPFIELYENILQKELDLVQVLKRRRVLLKEQDFEQLSYLKVLEGQIRDEQLHLIEQIDLELNKVVVNSKNINEVYKYYKLVSKFKSNPNEAFYSKIYRQLMLYEKDKQQFLEQNKLKEAEKIGMEIQEIVAYKNKKLG